MATLRRLRRREGGQAVIELALTLPLLLLVLTGIIDFGFQFQRYEVVTNAAREGARVGVLPGYSNADAETRALAYLAAGGIAGTNVSPCATPPANRALQANSMCALAIEEDTTLPGPPAKTVTQVRVIVEYDHEYTFVGPMVGLFSSSLGTVRLRAVSTMRQEAD